MSKAVAGVGAIFHRWDGTSTWAAIAEINNIGGPSMTRDTIDATSLDSVDKYREFISGFRDGGTVTLNMNFIRANYALFKTDFESDDLGNYEIILPDDDVTTLEFMGLVTELPLTIPPDEKITMDISIKISGKVALNSGARSSSPALVS